VENETQALARDILAHAMPKLEAAGYPIVLHVHDEAVAEVVKARGTVEEFEAIMAELPPWAEGFPLKASGGWRGLRFRKD
jgi:DNA polymerase